MRTKITKKRSKEIVSVAKGQYCRAQKEIKTFFKNKKKRKAEKTDLLKELKETFSNYCATVLSWKAELILLENVLATYTHLHNKTIQIEIERVSAYAELTSTYSRYLKKGEYTKKIRERKIKKFIQKQTEFANSLQEITVDYAKIVSTLSNRKEKMEEEFYQKLNGLLENLA